MTRKRTERLREQNKEYVSDVASRAKNNINKVKRHSSWRKPKHKSEDRRRIEDMVCESSSVNILTVRAVLNHLFGYEKLGIKGAIQRLLDEDNNVEIDGFGTFLHRDSKEKITNDISQPGTMTYTPANSTIIFKPASRLYWDHYQASMAAHMPSEPLPSNMHFSQRVTSMPFYKDWQRDIASLSAGCPTVSGDTSPDIPSSPQEG